jgi:hypothetical protein
MLVTNVRKGQFWGVASVFLFSLYGFLINPQTFNTFMKLTDEQMYIANLWAAWMSPLQHATYHMHNFGYDLLPRMWMTYGIFFVLIAFCFVMALRAMRKYNFNFSGND